MFNKNDNGRHSCLVFDEATFGTASRTASIVSVLSKMLTCRLGNSYFIMLSVCVPMLNLLMFFHKNEDSFLFITCIFTVSGDTLKISVLRSTNMSNYINEQYSTKGCLHPILMLLIVLDIYVEIFFTSVFTSENDLDFFFCTTFIRFCYLL